MVPVPLGYHSGRILPCRCSETIYIPDAQSHFQAKLCHKGGTSHIRPVEILPSAPDSGTCACVNHIPDSLKICLTRFPVCKITRTEHSAQPFKFPPLFPVPSHCQDPVFLCKTPYQIFSQKSGCTCYKNCIFPFSTVFPILCFPSYPYISAGLFICFH